MDFVSNLANVEKKTMTFTYIACLSMLLFPVNPLKCPVQVFDSHDYVGCFADSPNRLLPHRYFLNGKDHPEIENNRCLLYCKDLGYKYAGTQNGDECHCGDDPLAYQNGPENRCNKGCYGDYEQICGGEWRLSVYNTRRVPLEQHERNQTRYMLVANNMILTAPAAQIQTPISKIQCASFCSKLVSCKVFVFSRGDGQCRLYQKFVISCEGVKQINGFQVYMMK